MLQDKAFSMSSKISRLVGSLMSDPLVTHFAKVVLAGFDADDADKRHEADDADGDPRGGHADSMNDGVVPATSKSPSLCRDLMLALPHSRF
jgi:hypothetical protein